MRKSKRGRASLIAVLAGFAFVLVVLGVNQLGLPVTNANPQQDLQILSREETSEHVKEASGKADTLLVVDGADTASEEARSMFSQVMKDMRVSCDTLDLSKRRLRGLSGYRRVVVLTTMFNVRDAGNSNTLASYARSGGSVMLATMPYTLSALGGLAPSLGIKSSSSGKGAIVSDFVPEEGFMLGAGQAYQIDNAVNSSLNVKLAKDANVEARTSKGDVPLVWTRDYGKGRFVVCNFQYYGKAYRGVFSSAFSLLDDACIWPVIDASVWWLDDFPSPVPQGDGQYIERDYHMSIAQFYSRVWWPDVLQLSREHGFSYSGGIIETYERKTEGELGGEFSTDSYLYYGNQLFNSGGEIGYHGYNHQPLCGPGYTYEQDRGYETWESADEMSASLSELERFTAGLYRGISPTTYVPPSNILSEEGRDVIVERHPEIRAIASTYLPGADAYSQEFTVSKDGEIEMPRVVSGENLDSYMRFAAFSELNFHYVNSHFMHPDDLLDEDRGAALGWETLKSDLESYMNWVDSAAPQIYHVTASGMAAHVQRFANVSPRVSREGKTIRIELDGFHDKAWLMLRLNGDEVRSVRGAQATKLNGNLYLLEATDDEVTVTRSAS